MNEHENPAIRASHLPAVLLEAVAENHGLTLDEDTVRDIEDRYVGGASSIDEWAAEYLENAGGLGTLDESLYAWFDFAGWAESAEMFGDIEVYTSPTGWVEVLHTH